MGKHKGFLERLSESDHEELIEDLKEMEKENGPITDDAVDDVDESVVTIDPETLAVIEETP